MNKITLLKKIDTLFGVFLARTLPASQKTQLPISINNILFIRPGGIGDAVLLVPTIQRIHKRYPNACISILAERRNAPVFHLVPFVTNIYHYDNPASLSKANLKKYELIIDTEQWHRLSAVVCRLCRPQFSIGYSTNKERSRLLSAAVPYSQDTYEGESFLNLLSPLGLTSSFPQGPFLSIPESAKTAANQLRENEAPFVTLFPGASIAERRWDSDCFRQVVLKLNQKNIPVVIVGGPGDIQEAEKIIANTTTNLNLAGKTTLVETAAIISDSSLLISGDSGILHLAVGLDKPTVSLFGPGIAAKWAPRGERHIVINKNLACSPCTRFGYTPKCPRDAACMKAITPEEVLEAAHVLLAITSSQ